VNGRRPDSGSVVWTVLNALAVPQRNETLSDDLILFESRLVDSIGKLKGRAGQVSIAARIISDARLRVPMRGSADLVGHGFISRR
jgi:hypothetical protein